jgi:hypothetical protein
MMKLFTVLALLACSAGLSSCGAFADVFEEPDGEPTLQISPEPVIFQGQPKQVTITFLKNPPWASDPTAKGYMTDFDVGEDIEHYTQYDGVKTIQADLRAFRNAETGPRKLQITVAYEKTGQKQQTHSGWAWLLVIATDSGDGGTR